MASIRDSEILRTSNKLQTINRTVLLKFALIGIVLAASFIFVPSVVIGNRITTLLFLLFSGVLGLVFLLHWPTLGLILVMAGSMFLRFSAQGGFNISEIGIALMLGICIMNMLFFQQKVQMV